MILTREKLEKLEDKNLAPYAIRAINSKGRLYPDNEPKNRTRFQRDRDRILHTTAFRRLEYKTQVFIIDEGDYYRTRLTHTLEVAQIARSIARSLGANEDLTEAICLAHDLGHPPFGHSGEEALAKLMKDHGGFDHNKQSFRIVTKLEKRYPSFPGLNLSWEVLEGIVKHETEYDVSDAKDFNPELKGHMEAQIANVADELAFTAHDLDDGLRSRMISHEMLEGVELWEIIRDKSKLDCSALDDLTRHQIIRDLIGILIDDILENTLQNLHQYRIDSVEKLQQQDRNLVGYNNEMHRKNRALKDFLYKNLYRHYRVMRMAMKAERVISDLFHSYQDDQRIMPNHFQNQIQEKGLERTICDYIAGMTDRYAVEEHNKLFNPGILP